MIGLFLFLLLKRDLGVVSLEGWGGSANAAFLFVSIHASFLMLWVKRH